MKTFSIYQKLAFVLLFFNLIANSQNSLDENLLVYYPFDNNLNDKSANMFHATGNASLTEDRFGKINSAYHFNGIDQFIDFPNDDLLKPQLPISFSFWVNFEDLEVTKTFVFTSDFAQNANTGINLSMTSTSNNIAIAYGDGGSPSSNSRRTKIGTTSIEINKWYFVVATISGPTDMSIYLSEYGSNATTCLYQNGTYSGNGSTIKYSTNPGTIGRTDAHSSKPPYYFKGKIDEFRMWDKELNFNEINKLCQNENTLSTDAINSLKFIAFYNKNLDILQFKNLSKNNNITIYNSLGQLVFNKKNTINKIPIYQFKKGIYFIKVVDGTGHVHNLKFIK